MAKRKESPGWRRFWDDEDMAQDQPQAEEFGTPAEPESQEASAEDVSGDLLSSIRKINRRKLKSKKTKSKCQQWRCSKIVIEEGKGKVEEGS